MSSLHESIKASAPLHHNTVWLSKHSCIEAHIISKMATNLLSVFTGIGLSEQKAKETIKNEAISKNLEQVITDVRYAKVL